MLAGLLTVAALREQSHQTSLRRQERALALVTRSEVVPRRLGPARGINPEAHGNYRGQSGADLAVLTVSNLAPAPDSSIGRGSAMRAGGPHLAG